MPTDPAAPLTTRERKVLSLLLTGKWLKSIAEELKVDNMVDLAKKFWQMEEKTSDHFWVHGERRNYYLLCILDVYTRKIIDWMFEVGLPKRQHSAV